MLQENRHECIKGYIDSRKEDNQEPMPCIFQISTPKYICRHLEENTFIKTITDILDKYNIKWSKVDTVGGAYNLNRDFIETEDIPCYIEYCGVYPVNWDINDIVTLEKMDYDGKLIIKVLWHKNDEYIPNN